VAAGRTRGNGGGLGRARIHRRRRHAFSAIGLAPHTAPTFPTTPPPPRLPPPCFPPTYPTYLTHYTPTFPPPHPATLRHTHTHTTTTTHPPHPHTPPPALHLHHHTIHFTTLPSRPPHPTLHPWSTYAFHPHRYWTGCGPIASATCLSLQTYAAVPSPSCTFSPSRTDLFTASQPYRTPQEKRSHLLLFTTYRAFLYLRAKNHCCRANYRCCCGLGLLAALDATGKRRATQPPLGYKREARGAGKTAGCGAWRTAGKRGMGQLTPSRSLCYKFLTQPSGRDGATPSALPVRRRAGIPASSDRSTSAIKPNAATCSY